MNLWLTFSGWFAFALLAVYSLRRFLKTAEVEAQLRATEARLEEQKQNLQDSRQQLETTFRAVASEALSRSSEDFLKLASERLDKKTTEGRAALDEKVQTFQKMIDPIRDLMSKVDTDINRVEKERLAQFSRISEQLLAVSASSEVLRKEASSLSSALRRPEVRGSWGEIQLRRVVELAGMSSYCDFEEQVSTRSEDGLQKPDLIVRLPNNRVIVVDAKAVFDAFIEAVQAEDPVKKASWLEKHAKNIRSRVSNLSRKSYWEQFENTPDFCVLFIPNEALLASAVEVDRALIEDALAEKIVIATPTTLVALLKAVAYGWQQNQLAENAQKIMSTAKELLERLGTWTEHMSRVGERLESTVKSYNDAVGSLEARVLPSARRIQEMAAVEEMAEIEPISLTPRALAKPALEANNDSVTPV